MSYWFRHGLLSKYNENHDSETGKFTSAAGGGSYEATASMRLPKNRKRVTIDQAAYHLSLKGYKQGDGKSAPNKEGKWVTTYMVTDPKGNTSEWTPKMVNAVIYGDTK